MNFQDLSHIESSKFFLDLAFRRARERAGIKKVSIKEKSKNDQIKKARITEELKIRGVQGALTSRFEKILTAFPKIDELPPFYNKLIKITIDYATLKRALGAINWANQQIDKFSNLYASKVSRGTDITSIEKHRKAYYGRISSVVRQIDKSLAFLEESRKIMKGFPNVKTKMFTVALFGFPNVGKTTLLSRMTGSTPEINSYAFTTKKLNIGNFTLEGKKIQVIDTPGTLDRFDKMNPMERQAQLVLEHAADLIVYIFDLTEPFPLNDQKKLYRKIATNDLPHLVYMTKKDLVDPKRFAAFKKQSYLDTFEDLQQAICKRWHEKDGSVSDDTDKPRSA